MQRTQVSRCLPVLSALSTAYGLLEKDDRIKKRLILDIGKDFLNAFIFGDGRISSYKVGLVDGRNSSPAAEQVLMLLKAFPLSDLGVEEILFTGDRAQDQAVLRHLEGQIPVSFRIAAPLGIPKLNYPRYASVAGLLSVADEIESKMPILHADRGIFSNVKQKALSFINEYF